MMYYQLPPFVRQLHHDYSIEKSQVLQSKIRRRKIVIFSGAGLSAESGISTFRGGATIWNTEQNARFLDREIIEEDLVGFLDFHNARRREMLEAKPNAAHRAIAELEDQYDVQVITQNIDQLHEQAGSHEILHLHGSIQHTRPVGLYGEQFRLPWRKDIGVGELDPKTHRQLRPDIVLFGEQIYGIDDSTRMLAQCDIVIVVGTSLVVEPAASLLRGVHPDAEVYYVNIEHLPDIRLPIAGRQLIGPATEQVPLLTHQLRQALQ